MTLPELRRVAEKAIPGPWKVDGRASLRVIDNADATIASGGIASRDFEEGQRNSEYIAAASPDAIIDLLDRYEKLHAAAVRLAQGRVEWEIGGNGVGRYICRYCSATDRNIPLRHTSDCPVGIVMEAK